MKSKILIVLLSLMWFSCCKEPDELYAQTSVPNTETFSLQDVYNVVHGHAPSTTFDLNSCIANAIPEYYDQTWYNTYTANSLLRFRNYTIPSTTVAVGDSYQGGIVAYLFQPGDMGYGLKLGIICAPSNQSNGIRWGTTSVVSTSTLMFSSTQNTENIIDVNGSGGGVTSYAALLCSELSLNGYDDWVLPSYDEMTVICENRLLIGGFINNNYWTSSQSTYDNHQAFIFAFPSCVVGDANKEAYIISVRAIRYF
jgi:hypothetical protein